MNLLKGIDEKLTKWKRMGYEPHAVYPFTSGDEQIAIVFRTLTKREFEELGDLKQGPETAILGALYTEQFKEIIETALLWPVPLPDNLPAAIDRQLAEAIVEASAWISTDKLVVGLEEARQEASSLEGFLRSRICAAFPNKTLADIKEMRFSEMMELTAMSEVITGMPVDLEPWLDPENYEKRMMRSEKQQRREMAEMQQGVVSTDKRLMRDPEQRRKLMAHAQQSRERLRSVNGKQIDLQKSMKEQAQGLGLTT